MTRFTRFSIVLLLPALLALAACRGGDDVGQTEEGNLVLGEAEAEQVVERGVLLDERTLILDSFRGSIELMGTNSDRATFAFVKRGRGGDQEAAREALDVITIEERGDDVAYRYTITTDEPELTSVDIRGEVPTGTDLRIQVENGSVALSAIEGAIFMEGQNLGPVRIGGATESVEVETRNGDIALGMQRLPETGNVRLRTTNGDLLLTLPADAQAQVEAQTAAGEIAVEGLEFEDRTLEPQDGGARFGGRLGESGPDVLLWTESGSVILREGRVPTLAALGSFPQADLAIDSLAIDSLAADSLATGEATVARLMTDRLMADSLAADTVVLGVISTDTATTAPDTTTATLDTTAAPDTTTTAPVERARTETLRVAPDTAAAAPDTATPDTTAATLTERAPPQTLLVAPEDTLTRRATSASVNRVAASVDSITALTDSITALADSIAASVDSLSGAVDQEQ